MILALIQIAIQVFLVVYLSFVVVEGLSFSTGLCSVRGLKWYSFWDAFPLVSPQFIEGRLEKTQYDIEGNSYDYHVWLMLKVAGVFDISFESSVGLVFLNPTWNFWGLTGNRDLSNPVEVPKAEVMSDLNDYQKSKL